MKLLTKEILGKLPPLYANENKDFREVKVVAKFFHAVGNASWYVTEFDPKERMFFGFVNLGDDMMAELGYFSLNELEEYKDAFLGLTIERDLSWNPDTSLEEVMSFKVR